MPQYQVTRWEYVKDLGHEAWRLIKTFDTEVAARVFINQYSTGKYRLTVNGRPIITKDTTTDGEGQ